MPPAVKPWKVVIVPDGSVKICDESGGVLRKYRGLVPLAVAHAKALRTLRRFQDVYWSIMGATNPVVAKDEGQQQDDSEDGRPF